MDDINNFNRRKKLRSHFGEAAPEKGLYFKSNSSWEPPNPHCTFKTFTESFKNKLMNNIERTQTKMAAINTKKINKKEIKAMNNLKEREDIVITNTNKRGAIVISDVKDYVEEANRQLSNKKHYQKLPTNPTTEHAALVENAIDSV